MRTFGERLKDRRKEMGKTLRVVAGEVGVAFSYIADLEADRRRPSEDVLLRLSDILQLDCEELAALAGVLGERTECYLKRNPEAVYLMRMCAQRGLSAEQLQELCKSVSHMALQRMA